MLQQEACDISKAVSKPVESFAKKIRGHEPYVFEMKKTVENGQCVFLADNRCLIYEVRPLICRFYPFELRTVEQGRYEFAYTSECQGIGKGQKVERSDYEVLFRDARNRLFRNTTDSRL